MSLGGTCALVQVDLLRWSGGWEGRSESWPRLGRGLARRPGVVLSELCPSLQSHQHSVNEKELTMTTQAPAVNLSYANESTTLDDSCDVGECFYCTGPETD